MIRKCILLLQIIMIVSLNACLLSKTLMLDNAPPNTIWDPDFETGLIFESSKPKSILIVHGPQVTIREFLTRTIVYDEEVNWHTNTSIALDPGKYIVDFHVKYFGSHIWKYKGFFMVDENAPTHLILKTPRFVTAQPKVVFR
ncbi:MAG: hypothetical protein HOB84_13995 [Candidatus Marinimicrobia bacterium]|jgi:hypothetical protein|nr:hypothetical protein [Candidatus Neomarinimicrobiota bacterium]MBT4715875.1 hypothetical protein [Candidatus Neomarinimicrobiota bacterium]